MVEIEHAPDYSLWVALPNDSNQINENDTPNMLWLIKIRSASILMFSFVDFRPSQQNPYGIVREVHYCSKSIELEMQLIKANNAIRKLQTRCIEKTSELIRLRSALKRSEMSKCTLKEILNEIQKKK